MSGGRAGPGPWSLLLIGGGLFVCGVVLRVTDYPEGVLLTFFGMLLVIGGTC